MRRKSIILLLCSILFTMQIATFGATLDDQIYGYAKGLRNAQKQLDKLMENSYLEDKNNSALTVNSQLVEQYRRQVQQISDEIIELSKNNGLSENQKGELQTLQGAALYVIYMADNLERYINTDEGRLEYTYLKRHFQADSILGQLFVFFED